MRVLGASGLSGGLLRLLAGGLGAHVRSDDDTAPDDLAGLTPHGPLQRFRRRGNPLGLAVEQHRHPGVRSR